MSRYQKVMKSLPALEKCLMDFFLSRYFNCPNFITVAPETRDNEIYQSYEYAVMTSVLSEAWYPIEPFE